MFVTYLNLGNPFTVISSANEEKQCNSNVNACGVLIPQPYPILNVLQVILSYLILSSILFHLRARSPYLVAPASSICLSQRLSHACLSTHGRYSETANGSLNQLWFLWSLAPLLLG